MVSLGVANSTISITKLKKKRKKIRYGGYNLKMENGANPSEGTNFDVCVRRTCVYQWLPQRSGLPLELTVGHDSLLCFRQPACDG